MISGDYIISAVVAVTTAAGGWSAGRRSTDSSAMQIATDTVDLLQAQIEALKDDKDDRDQELLELRTRVSVLENLVTQRAEVGDVHEDLRDARIVIDKIAVKVGA